MVTIVSGVIIILIGYIGIKNGVIKRYEVSIITFVVGIVVVTFLKESLGELLGELLIGVDKQFLKEILHGILLGIFFTKLKVKGSCFNYLII